MKDLLRSDFISSENRGHTGATYGHLKCVSFNSGKIFFGASFWLNETYLYSDRGTYVAETAPGDFPSRDQIQRLASSFGKRMMAADERSPVMFLLLTQEQANVLDFLGAVRGKNYRVSENVAAMMLHTRERLASRVVTAATTMPDYEVFEASPQNIEVTIFSPETYEAIVLSNELQGATTGELSETIRFPN